MRWAIAGVAAVLLTACTNTGDGNWVGAGQATETFVNTRVASAYIPLHHFSIPGMRRGAATIILSGIAVTNAHNANLVDDEDDLGHAPSGEDIMFIRVHEQPIGGAGPLKMADPEVGEDVILYGQGAGGSLRIDLIDALALARRSTTSVTRGAYVGPASVWIDRAELLA